jgi:hypothetical protein
MQHVSPTESDTTQLNSHRELLRSASVALMDRVRDHNNSGLADPRFGFAMADLLYRLGDSLYGRTCDSYLQAAGVRAARALIDMTAEQRRLHKAVLARCECPRHFRIDLEVLADQPITCSACGQNFTAQPTKAHGLAALSAAPNVTPHESASPTLVLRKTEVSAHIRRGALSSASSPLYSSLSRSSLNARNPRWQTTVVNSAQLGIGSMGRAACHCWRMMRAVGQLMRNVW